MAKQAKAFNSMVKKKMKAKKKDSMPMESNPTGADSMGMPVKKQEMGYASY
jgi:hypothetical protein